ncbi:YcaO-like family protein [Natrononativus amylolyticus]|uniref:YcaO-like family protein n=1 Tax=Natrononativus amylolyticus TaxID=2963434 RepID=UPI0020CECF49|nr:YcaO-like family protein [Natrononativus amylolyticus]
MEVHVVAEGPVREAIVSALGDVDLDVRDVDASDLESARFAVVSGVAGAETFAEATEAARAGSTPWLAVEIGGVGGRPLPEVEAAVSGFAPATGCFECLRTRVAAGFEGGADRPRADRATARLAGAVAGRECVRVLSGDDRSVIGQVLEFPHARRRLHPVPGCDCDSGGRPRDLELTDDESVDLETAVERAETAIDPRVGLLASIGEAESYPAPYYLAETAETDGFSDASAPEQAAGVDPDWNAALMKATGEALERYCAAVYREDDLVRATIDDLEAPISPETLVRPDDAPAIDDETEYHWVEGRNLETGETVHLPAAAVQFPQPGERLLPAITTGLGLGSSTVDALVSGLTEVIERDATMLAWYSTFEPAGLAVDHEGFDALARRVESEGLSVTPLLVTQDVDVPVVAVAVHREDGWPRFAVGSACGLDAAETAYSALAEATQNWMELRGLGPEEAASQSGAIGEYASFPDEVRGFVSPDETVSADAVGPETTPTGADALEALLSRVTDVGLTPYASRLTTRDVAGLGFEGVRVVVPGAQPLFTREPFFGERARTVPAELGYEPALEREYHPYP